MNSQNLIVFEEDLKIIDAELSKLHNQINAKVTCLVDKNGQLISSVGETRDLDTTSLASLTAGNIAATGGIAKLLGEKEFTILFHEGERDNIHISIIGQRIILVIVFDQRTSLGLVRLRVKKSAESFAQIFDRIEHKSEKEKKSKDSASSSVLEITEDDIDKLFG